MNQPLVDHFLAFYHKPANPRYYPNAYLHGIQDSNRSRRVVRPVYTR
ncbi:MAG: hypothetical protein VX709_06675 [Pseudomonadota bacterium]|nr:hypothetical protein [Pseudomonadota bacterium]MEC8822234.1 hypothetical protein [Pseudomonadota bacterium]